MKALVIIAHGSRRAESNAEVARLADRVRGQADEGYRRVEHAFLELAEPDLPSVIDKLVDEHMQEIVVLPYFLNSGNHVAQDIPALLQDASEKHSDCTFRLAQPIGMYEGMPDLILDSARLA